jgi:putative FmdB family regulatory protein
VIYEYRCQACDQVQEVWAKLSDPPPTACTACGQGPLDKLISANSFALKGGGWYATDYKPSGTAAPAKKE